jgi:hypothetical protein
VTLREDDERRRHRRKPVRHAARLLVGPRSLSGRLEEHGVWHECVIMDISPGGAKISLEALLEIGAPVRLEVGAFGKFPAEIAWAAPREFGLRFVAAAETMTEVVMGLAVYGAA